MFDLHSFRLVVGCTAKYRMSMFGEPRAVYDAHRGVFDSLSFSFPVFIAPHGVAWLARQQKP